MSNLGGPFGVKQFCAIVNPPQSAILAIGSGKILSHFILCIKFFDFLPLIIPLVQAAERRVVPGSGADQYKFSSLMSATLSCDHRVIDGKLFRLNSFIANSISLSVLHTWG